MNDLESKSDKELMNFMNNGKKEEVFNILYKRHNKGLYYFCLNLCADKSLAEEMSLVTFSKFFRYSKSFTSSPDAKFTTWLYKIAKNSMIDYYREQKKYRDHIVSLDGLTEDEDGNAHPVSVLESCFADYEIPQKGIEFSQKREILLDAVGKLGKKYSTLIDLRYFKQLSYKEIAEEMELPMGTVKNNLFRAKESLMNLLKSKENILLRD